MRPGTPFYIFSAIKEEGAGTIMLVCGSSFDREELVKESRRITRRTIIDHAETAASAQENRDAKNAKWKQDIKEYRKLHGRKRK